MPIDFPNSPSTNDEFTSGSTTWRWDGSVWKVVRDFAPTGATGAVGPTGAVGATGVTGINWEAAFDFIGYSVGDVVQYSGSAYYCNTAIAIGDIMSHIPGSSARWDLLAAKGAVGTTGPTGAAGAILAINNNTGTSYTLQLTDLNDLVTLNNASAITLTVPPSVFSPNDVINITQTGAGQVTFAQGSGVTIVSTGTTASAPKLRAQYSAASVICTASDTFLVVGDIS